MSQALRDARRYEEGREEMIRPEDRPAFHLCARVGWMNDPNGFSYYMGHYHMFYQYHPYSSHWGPMHWGHAVSEDLLHWKYLPAALAPDRLYDRDGVFSGSAVTMPDGRQLLMYTGVANDLTDYMEGRAVQTQNIAFGDGTDYEKYEGNPVITESLLPEGGSRYDFRDPKIWQEADGTYKAIIANNDKDGGGQMLVFKSDDALHWEYDFRLASNHGRIGRMWECPDFFELDGRHVLIASSQDMLPQGFEYHNGNGTFYMIGEYDADSHTFLEECDYAIDYGIDFYAPQTIQTPDGRRVMIGWMQNWDTCNLHTAEIPWFGQMTVPRELSIRNGRLIQKPIRELEDLRTDPVEYENVLLEDNMITLGGIEGRMIDLTVEISAADPQNMYKKFALRFAQNDIYHTSVSYRTYESVLKIDRKFSGSRRAIIHQRRAYVPMEEGKITLRLILDRFSAEIFVNDGEKVLSAVINTELEAKGISFFADGKVSLNVKKYSIVV